MTDGIIQEVMRDFLERQLKEQYQQDILLLDRKEFMELQQELIEKIEQKRVWQWDAVRLRDLIGDNQE